MVVIRRSLSPISPATDSAILRSQALISPFPRRMSKSWCSIRLKGSPLLRTIPVIHLSTSSFRIYSGENEVTSSPCLPTVHSAMNVRGGVGMPRYFVVPLPTIVWLMPSTIAGFMPCVMASVPMVSFAMSIPRLPSSGERTDGQR